MKRVAVWLLRDRFSVVDAVIIGTVSDALKDSISLWIAAPLCFLAMLVASIVYDVVKS